MWFKLIMAIIATLAGGVGVIFIMLGVEIMKTPNHVWEKRRQELRQQTNSEQYFKDRLWEEVERVEYAHKRKRA